jgi:ribosome biogenesis SPOUT family RNA methylase Rps3
MRTLAGPSSEVHFTHLSRTCLDALMKSFGGSSVGAKADEIAVVFCTTGGVLDLIEAIDISWDKVCLLDPKAERELSPEDSKRFTNFLIGVGIDNLPRIRWTNFGQGDFGYIKNT